MITRGPDLVFTIRKHPAYQCRQDASLILIPNNDARVIMNM